MARGCALLEILRRHAPDARELLRERPFAPHRGPYAVRPYRRDAAVLGGGGGFAVVAAKTAPAAHCREVPGLLPDCWRRSMRSCPPMPKPAVSASHFGEGVPRGSRQ